MHTINLASNASEMANPQHHSDSRSECGIGGELYARIRAEGVLISRSRSEKLFCAGEPAPEIYLIDEGVVGLVHRCVNDLRHILAILVPPSLIVPAKHIDETLRYSAECLSDSKFYALSRTAIDRLAQEDEQLRIAIEDELGKSIDRAHDNLINLLCRNGAARVASMLCQLDLDFQRPSGELGAATRRREWADISQVDLAAALGMTPVYLNQILKKMKESNQIELISGKIKSINSIALKEIDLKN